MLARVIKSNARKLVAWAVKQTTFIDKMEDGFIERVLLGTILSITPSGKIYTPWANSNVNICPRCKGEGCDFCGQLGSREAYEDEIFHEALEAAAKKKGWYITSGEGSMNDLFIEREIDIDKVYKFYKEKKTGDYLCIDPCSYRKYYKKLGSHEFEGRAVAIVNSISSICTTGVSAGYLKSKCKRVISDDVPIEWLEKLIIG